MIFSTEKAITARDIKSRVRLLADVTITARGLKSRLRLKFEEMPFL